MYFCCIFVCLALYSTDAYSWSFYEPILQPTQKTFLDEQFADLEKLPTGMKLLNELEENFKLSKYKLKIIQGEHTFFKPEKPPLECNILSLSEKFFYEKNFVGCIDTRSFFDSNEKEAKVGQASNPAYITLGHELIHFFHYLEDPTGYKKNLIKYTAEPWNGLMPVRDHEKLWNNDEEQRTVLSTIDEIYKSKLEDKAVFSENQLRIEAGHAPRYAYHDFTRHFYEDPKIINFILNTLFFNSLNKETILKSLECQDWIFNEQEASDNNYSFFNRGKSR